MTVAERTVAPPRTAPAPVSPQALRTEFAFTLPRGFIDESGTVHREGAMRLATARDEIRPQMDQRVKENPAYLTILLLERSITRLGTLREVDAWVVENMFASDLAFLQDLYRRINQEGHTQAAVTCPACQHAFTVDIAGERPGGS